MDLLAKLLRHRDRISGIVSGQLLPPVMVDVDPVNGVCNLDCEWCCQAASRASQPTSFMPVGTMQQLGKFSGGWGIKAWRISSDSEPLLNKDIAELIAGGDDYGIGMGLITNGVFLERIFDCAERLTWVGVSLDAATAETWSKLKRSPTQNFTKILNNVHELRQRCPTLDISLKFLRWTPQENLSKHQFAVGQLPMLAPTDAGLPSNVAEAELLPELADSLGVHAIVKNSYPSDMAEHYRFTVCQATPLGGVFGADHRFHLCCDARSIYVLTDDYTRDDWGELPRLWGSERHLELIRSITPKKCAGCAKAPINEVLEHIVGTTPTTAKYQPNFI